MLDQANAAMVAHRFDSRFTFAAAVAAQIVDVAWPCCGHARPDCGFLYARLQFPRSFPRVRAAHYLLYPWNC